MAAHADPQAPVTRCFADATSAISAAIVASGNSSVAQAALLPAMEASKWFATSVTSLAQGTPSRNDYAIVAATVATLEFAAFQLTMIVPEQGHALAIRSDELRTAIGDLRPDDAGHRGAFSTALATAREALTRGGTTPVELRPVSPPSRTAVTVELRMSELARNAVGIAAVKFTDKWSIDGAAVDVPSDIKLWGTLGCNTGEYFTRTGHTGFDDVAFVGGVSGSASLISSRNPHPFRQILTRLSEATLQAKMQHHEDALYVIVARDEANDRSFIAVEYVPSRTPAADPRSSPHTLGLALSGTDSAAEMAKLITSGTVAERFPMILDAMDPTGNLGRYLPTPAITKAIEVQASIPPGVLNSFVL